MLPEWADQTITILTPTITVVRGVKSADWTNPTRTPSEGWSVQPLKGGRDFEYGSGVVDTFVLYGPEDAEIDPGSRLELPDQDGQFTIIDGPHRPRSVLDGLGLPGGTSHTKLTATRKAG